MRRISYCVIRRHFYIDYDVHFSQVRYGLLDKVGMAVEYVPCFITRNLLEEVFEDSRFGKT